MSGAFKIVANGMMGVNRTADQYGVLKSTLKDWLSGRHETKSGLQPYLPYYEHRENLTTYVQSLVTFLIQHHDKNFLLFPNCAPYLC